MKTISGQCSQGIGEEIGEGTMSGMFYLCNVLKLVIDGFHQSSFPEDNLVIHGHQDVLHVTFDLGNELDSIHEKKVEKSFIDIAFVSV